MEIHYSVYFVLNGRNGRAYEITRERRKKKKSNSLYFEPTPSPTRACEFVLSLFHTVRTLAPKGSGCVHAFVFASSVPRVALIHICAYGAK